MAFTQSQFSRKQSLDVRGAMALALARHLAQIDFPLPSGGSFRFTEVFDAWPRYTDRFVSPAACVLPSSWTYDAARLTPTLLEDTWEPQNEQGFGLYKLADITLDFEVNVRAPSDAERSAILMGIETAWVEPDVLMNHESGARYGVVLPMPEYWGVCAGYALKSARILDDEGHAMREQREAIMVVTAQAPQVKLGPVRPLTLSIKLDPDDP